MPKYDPRKDLRTFDSEELLRQFVTLARKEKAGAEDDEDPVFVVQGPDLNNELYLLRREILRRLKVGEEILRELGELDEPDGWPFEGRLRLL